jgi:type II restriction/modification system DNA methylase subunit YeeA
MAGLTPQEFVSRWRGVTLKERSGSQSHFIDLCRLVGQPTPTEADPTGEFYTFERGAEKSAGPTGSGHGWADVWRKRHFAWEYKGPRANLEKAYQQLQQYRESLENPPLLVVSDLQTIEVHTNFTNSVKRVSTFTLDDLLDPENLDQLRRVWTDPFSFRAAETPENVTEQAARECARLAESLRQRGEDPDRAAHFLIRLLFCLFAEDVGLLPEKLFSKLVAATRTNPEAFTTQLRQLFIAMRDGGFFGFEKVPRFDGGLFDDDEVLMLDREGLDVLHRAGRLDWDSIEPSILGTLFERSLDPIKRAQLGAHYTSREDILAVVEPVLMAPLRQRWAEVREQVETLAERRDAASGGQATRLNNDLSRLLSRFAEEIASVRVLDPACGSGNFLSVSMQQLLNLEKEVITFARDVGLPAFFPRVGPEQVHGIELDEYAHELATATVWIGYIQWLRDNGFGRPAEPILKPLETVTQMDAILAFDEQGNPVEPEWPEAGVIVGNPPFLGGKRMRAELEDRYVDDLFAIYRDRVPREADLVCYWFEKAREQVESGKTKRVGLLATNSIRGGANRRVLQRVREIGGIFFAESDRPWVLEGAAVRVSMVGFDGGEEREKVLDGAPVEDINADLTGSLDLTGAKRLLENLSIAFMGDTKGGPFDLTPGVAREMLSAGGNPNGRPNSEVVRPWVNAMDITRRPRGYHVIDFGTEMSLEEAALYEVPFESVNERVRPKREQSRSTRVEWWLHERPRVEMRLALAELSRFLGTPTVAKHRLFVWLDGKTLPDHQIIAFARDDDYFFGVLHSRVHELWARRMGTWMGVGNDLRYTPTTCFETFPLPWPSGEEPEGDSRIEAIAEAARHLDELRRNWLNPEGASETELKKRTLTNLYNSRPTWLQNAHERLDAAVLAAYGWPPDLSDEEILQNLLVLNLERSKAISRPPEIGL